jgi:excisionase family DNA binding protein
MEYFTIRELSKVSRLSESTLRRRIEDGSLPVIQPGGHRTRMLFASDVLEKLIPVVAESDDDLLATRNNKPSRSAQQLAGPLPRWKRRT